MVFLWRLLSYSFIIGQTCLETPKKHDGSVTTINSQRDHLFPAVSDVYLSCTERMRSPRVGENSSAMFRVEPFGSPGREDANVSVSVGLNPSSEENICR